MIRSYYVSAKWTHSPHELAKEYTNWRCFRHLTYWGIRSYLLGAFGYGHHSRLRSKFGRSYHYQLDIGTYPPDCGENGWPGWVHAYCKTLRHEGLYDYVPLQKRLKMVGVTSWEENDRNSHFRNKIAFRLGTSCVLCGAIQRGHDALTDRRRTLDWLGLSFLPGGWVPRDLLVGNGFPRLMPNPLCSGCWSQWGGMPLPVSKIILKATAKRIRAGVAA